MIVKITKTFTYQLHPNAEEAETLRTILSATTFCHNLYLHYNKLTFERSEKKIDLSHMFRQLPVFRQKYEKLQGIHETYLNSSIVHLFYALKPIHSSDQFPAFLEQNRRIVLLRDYQIDQDACTLSLPGSAPISYTNSRPLKGTVKAVHLVEKFDKWYMDVILEQQIRPKPFDKPLRFLGIDVGLNDFAILSNGTKISNPRFYRTMEEKLKKEQQALSRKEKGSANWTKQLAKVRNVHQKIYHARMDFLHQLSTYILDEYDVIGIEKLAIAEMKQDRRFAKSVQDASWGTFVKLLKYKAKEKGKIIVEVDRFFPSTKTCSRCGNKEIMPLHLRIFRCRSCGLHIHRDYNASLNMEQKAIHYAFAHNLSGNGGSSVHLPSK